MKILHILVAVLCTSLVNCEVKASKYPGHTFFIDPEEGRKFDAVAASPKSKTIEACMLEITQNYDPDLDSINLDEFCKKYAACVVIFATGRPPKTTAMYGELFKTAEMEKYKGYRLRLEFGGLRYDTDNNEHGDTSVVLVKWLHNEQPAGYVTSLIEETFTATTTTSVTRRKGIHTSASATVGVKYNGLIVKASASVTVSGSYSQDKESTNSFTSSHTYFLQENVTIAANTSAQVIWTLKESRQKVKWTAFVKITGWIAVQLREPFNGKTLWILPVGDLGYYANEFFERLNVLEMNYIAKGIIEDTKSMQSTVTAYEFPFSEKLVACD